MGGLRRVQIGGLRRMGGFIDGVGMGGFIDGVGMGGFIDGVGMGGFINISVNV